MDYYPYGSPRLDEKAGSFNEKRKFAGHEYDGETGLSYMVARYYDGGVGRFYGQDPAFWDGSHLLEQLIDPQSWNSYAYARNNPMRYVDLDGRFMEEFMFFQGMFNAGVDLLRSSVGTVKQLWHDPRGTVKQVVGGVVQTVTDIWNDPLGSIAGAYNDIKAQYNAFMAMSDEQRAEVLGQGAVTLGVDWALIKGAGKAVKLMYTGDIGGRGIAKVLRSRLSTETRASLEAWEEKGWKVGSRQNMQNKTYQNKEGLLPKQSEGYYTEWDVNPWKPGENRDNLRFVTGQGGEQYLWNKTTGTMTEISQ